MTDSEQSVRVERLHDWFAVQLHFVEEFVSRTGLPLVAAVTLHTNLHRRFGFGRPAKVSWAGTAEQQFGCFSFEVPSEGVIRLHFSPNDTRDGIGPLARSKYSMRINELTDGVDAFRQRYGT